MRFLLDVNVLIALIDPRHIMHNIAHDWFDREGQEAWATCPLTENGAVRIVGNPSYANSPGSPAVVMNAISELRNAQGHAFWPDDISVLDRTHIDPDEMLTSGQLTDTYLLALAKAHGGKLATFDRRLSTSAVRGGKAALHLIGA